MSPARLEFYVAALEYAKACWGLELKDEDDIEGEEIEVDNEEHYRTKMRAAYDRLLVALREENHHAS